MRTLQNLKLLKEQIWVPKWSCS